MLKTLSLFISMFFLITGGLFANNMSVSGALITNTNGSGGYTYVQFDISWENSWRDDVNWDAAWVFVKYRVGNGEWKHATLSTASGDHSAAAGSTISAVPDGKGVFIHRSEHGAGNNNWIGNLLKWNFQADGVPFPATVTVKVFAIEMVNVPTGAFYVGDGNISFWHWRKTLINTGVSNTIPAAPNYNTGGFASHRNNVDYGFYGPNTAYFPNGYSAFYCMKYELTEEQYVDFLNTLTLAQQVARTGNSPYGAERSAFGSFTIKYITIGNLSTSTPAVYGCDLDNDNIFYENGDGQNWVLEKYFWKHSSAYLDWSALRPMSTLEYEKACRGPLEPVSGEYAWGSSSVTYASSVTNYGSNTESVNDLNANALNVNQYTRAGIFAHSSSNRLTSGATYYGIMDMTGGRMELTLDYYASQLPGWDRRIHGDGFLDASGNHNISGLHSGNATGTQGSNIMMGGTHGGSSAITTVSDMGRTYNFNSGYGGAIRGVRTVQ